jgi:hypothetical protein
MKNNLRQLKGTEEETKDLSDEKPPADWLLKL